MARTSNDDDRGRGSGLPFAWLSVIFAAWIASGVAFANWALRRGFASDVGFSPYHVPAYLGLLALAAFCLLVVGRAVRHGVPIREAFPPGYGVLAAGSLVLLAYPVVDVAWREGIGIAIGRGSAIENGLAPSRLLIPIGLVLTAAGPLRHALASRAPEDGLPAVVSAGLVLAVLGFFSGFHPAFAPWLERPKEAPDSTYEIWVMDTDGRHQTRLIEADEGTMSWPSWSPNEAEIAYAHAPRGQDPPESDVWVASADGTGRRMLAGGPGLQWIPHWSPDGTWIVYTSEAPGGPSMAAGPPGPAVGPGAQGMALDLGASAPTRSHASIWRIRADGTGAPEQITDGKADDRAAAYSPDGSLLAFDSTRSGTTQIWVMNADGTNPRRLTQDEGEDWGASWSPDGKRIAFNSSQTGSQQIWFINADGSEAMRLTHDAMNDQEPAWSPDGSRVVFGQWDGLVSQIWSIATDGTDPRNLSRSPEVSTALGGAGGTWGRDGRIVYQRAAEVPASSEPQVRNDLAAAGMLLEAMLVLIVALVVVRVDPPFGGFAVIMGMASLLSATADEQWRFVPPAVLAGLIIDVLAHLAPARRRASVVGAAAPAGFVLGTGAAVAVTTGLGISPTLLLGIAFGAAAFGWGLAGVVRPLSDAPESEPVK